MDRSRKYLSPREVATIEGLRLRARHIVDGFLTGTHRSTFLGSSIDFAQHREYAPGDDPRQIDWKVYARTDKYYVKQFEDETNLPCLLALDCSRSMEFKGNAAAMSKLEYASCLAVALAWIISHQHDACGLATFNDRLHHWLEPTSEAGQLQALIDSIESTPRSPRTALPATLHEIANRMRRRGLVILISDFLDDVDSLGKGFAHLKHEHQDVIAIRVVDPDEEDFPFDDPTLFECLERDEPLTVDPALVQQSYLDEYRRFDQSIRQLCQPLSYDYFVARTDSPFDRVLSQYLSRRQGTPSS